MKIELILNIKRKINQRSESHSRSPFKIQFLSMKSRKTLLIEFQMMDEWEKLVDFSGRRSADHWSWRLTIARTFTCRLHRQQQEEEKEEAPVLYCCPVRLWYPTSEEKLEQLGKTFLRWDSAIFCCYKKTRFSLMHRLFSFIRPAT